MRLTSIFLIISAIHSPAWAMDNFIFDLPPTSPHLLNRVHIFEDPKSNDGWYARAVVRNVRGTYNEVEIEPTSEGDVHIQYRTSPPATVGDADSADEACAVSVPEGVVAIPECVTIMEEETETIFLYKHLGY